MATLSDVNIRDFTMECLKAMRGFDLMRLRAMVNRVGRGGREIYIAYDERGGKTKNIALNLCYEPSRYSSQMGIWKGVECHAMLKPHDLPDECLVTIMDHEARDTKVPLDDEMIHFIETLCQVHSL